MKQGILPLIPSGASNIDGLFSVSRSATEVIWFQGCHPIRVHPVNDHASQRAMMAFLHEHGGVPQARLAQVLGVHANTVLASVRLYRQKGDAGFYEPTRVRGAEVMTADVIQRCNTLLREGQSRSEVAAAVGVRKCNIDKAIQQKRLPPPTRSVAAGKSGTTRTERAAVDRKEADSGLGMACTRPIDRVLTLCGVLGGAETRFENSLDVAHGGVLCALPSLAANGLFARLDVLRGMPAGYYQAPHVFILLAFMALLRIKTVESLRQSSPGDFGILLGLDRIPEVRCLRKKLAGLASNPASVASWAQALSCDWMQADPGMAGTIYIDGHTRVYHGDKTELPRRYVARQRLCMRGVTDYWVNDREGKPFFYIDRPVDDGLLAVLRREIIPRLLNDVPAQPTTAELTADPRLYRFRIVFDRAGCSPAFLREAWDEKRIAVLTYKKNPGPDWSPDEFHTVQVTLVNGETESMELAERSVWFGNPEEGIQCREIRRLQRSKQSTHQTAIVCTDYISPMGAIAVAMFARWCQENFFRYMLIEFGLDLLAEHKTEVFPCSIPVLNPKWKQLDSECRSLRGKIAVAKLALANATLEYKDMERGRMNAWVEKKSLLLADVQNIEQKLDETRILRRETDKHVPLNKLPPECQFERLAPTRKLLLDTVRMIAYRSETALAALAQPAMRHPEEARTLIKAIFETSADLYPDRSKHQLRVVLHPLAEERLNKTVATILTILNDAEFTYPGTELRLVYELLPPAPA
jgi:transposase-like protein